MDVIKIDSEDSAFELLAKLVDGYKLEPNVEVQFESWPRFVITIKGEDFDGTIPTRIMPTILELQKEIHRVYARTVYGEDSTRKLTKKDREELELVVRIDKGSSVFETLLKDSLTKILQDAVTKMSPDQLVITLIVFGALITSVVGWKAYLRHKFETKQLDQTIELSKVEKEKMELIQKALQNTPQVKVISESADNVRNELLTKIKPHDHLSVDTGTREEPYPTPIQIDGEQASQITHKPREQAVERIVEGEFFLRSVDFARRDGVRAEIQRAADGYAFRADIPLGVLGDEQLEALKDNSWNRKNVVMSLLVRERNNNYTSAKVISVSNLAENDSSI